MPSTNSSLCGVGGRKQQSFGEFKQFPAIVMPILRSATLSAGRIT
jgi:hypothetical protein